MTNNINFEDAENLEPFFEEINLNDIETEEAANVETQAETQTETQAEKSTVNLSFIDAGTAINIIDSVLPNIICYAITLFFAKKVKPNNFSLTAQEKRTLEPLVKGCLEKMNFSTSDPFKALFITTTLIYGAKILQVDLLSQPEIIEKVETRGRPRKTPKE